MLLCKIILAKLVKMWFLTLELNMMIPLFFRVFQVLALLWYIISYLPGGQKEL
jgi:hypothetical protein